MPASAALRPGKFFSFFKRAACPTNIFGQNNPLAGIFVHLLCEDKTNHLSQVSTHWQSIPTTKERTSKYRILGFTTANEGEEPQWFSLEVRLHNSRVRISVTLSNFRNSPAQSEEFHKYFVLLLSENKDEEGEQEGQDTLPGRATLVDCFDWAISPCLTHFERLSPPPLLSSSGKLTLSHFLATTSFECDLIAADEVLVPGEIERLETDEDC